MAYIGKNEKGSGGWPGLSGTGVPDRPRGGELLPPVEGSEPHGVLPLTPPLGMGRAPASRHRLPEGGDNNTVQRMRDMGVDDLLGNPVPAGSLPIQLDRHGDAGCGEEGRADVGDEATRGPEAEETDEQNMEDLRKKYPWWPGGQGRGGANCSCTGLWSGGRGHCELNPREIIESVKCER